MPSPDLPEISGSTEVRVTYHDTDKMGHVYYSRYLVWFEIGRTELIRDRIQSGTSYQSYREMEEDGIFLPVRECFTRYHSPAFYDDLLIIHTRVSELKETSIRFKYRIERKEDGLLVVEGQTQHPFVSADRKILRIGLQIFGLK